MGKVDMATVQGYDFTLQGDPTRVRATVQQALETRKFRIAWVDDWTATAERGNKVANALAGAAAQYFKVGVAIRSGAEGTSILRVERQSSGWMGGALGAARTTKNLATLRGELEATFAAAGVLLGVAAI
jgi:hypothetical protein